jgi:SNF2 family DNA or RNA helicase
MFSCLETWLLPLPILIPTAITMLFQSLPLMRDFLRAKKKKMKSCQITAQIRATSLVLIVVLLFAANLEPLQEEGVAFLQKCETDETLRIALCLDEMGVGKTVQTLALIARHVDIKPITLILHPANIVMQWTESVRKFVPNLKVLLIAVSLGYLGYFLTPQYVVMEKPYKVPNLKRNQIVFLTWTKYLLC